jgi:hypothetical protein
MNQLFSDYDRKEVKEYLLEMHFNNDIIKGFQFDVYMHLRNLSYYKLCNMVKVMNTARDRNMIIRERVNRIFEKYNHSTHVEIQPVLSFSL